MTPPGVRLRPGAVSTVRFCWRVCVRPLLPSSCDDPQALPLQGRVLVLNSSGQGSGGDSTCIRADFARGQVTAEGGRLTESFEEMKGPLERPVCDSGGKGSWDDGRSPDKETGKAWKECGPDAKVDVLRVAVLPGLGVSHRRRSVYRGRGVSPLPAVPQPLRHPAKQHHHSGGLVQWMESRREEATRSPRHIHTPGFTLPRE